MTREEFLAEYGKYEITRQLYELVFNPDRIEYHAEEVEGFRINTLPFQVNFPTDCYREELVSYIPMLPLIQQKQVLLEEADYIIYTHGYARCDDMIEKVLGQLRYLACERKSGAEIIVVGKSANAKYLLNGEIDNITFVGDHYAEYLGKRFGFPEMKERYVVYDDYADQLNVWPVDGCNNKCAFCRRSYMYIRFESQTYTSIKRELDWYQENAPEKMRHVSLRAENLTEYGIDLYGKPMLHRIIALINSYEAVKMITIDIGMCIGEITPEILDALCKADKLVSIGLNPEVGSDRLLKFIGKKHTCKQAIEICNTLRKAHPKLIIESTVMVGIPTETIEDMYLLAELLHQMWPDYIHLNYYIHSKRDALEKYPQMSESLREYYLQILLKQLEKPKEEYKYLEFHPNIDVRHYFIWGKKRRSRKWIREKMKLEEMNRKNDDVPGIMEPVRVRYVFYGKGLKGTIKMYEYMWDMLEESNAQE